MTTGIRRCALAAATALVGLAGLGVALWGVPDAVEPTGGVVTLAAPAPETPRPAAPSPHGPAAPSSPAPETPTPETPAPQPPAPAGTTPAVLGRLPAGTTQALVVDAPDEDATTATVTGWRRDGAGWVRALGPYAAHLGADGPGPTSEETKHTPVGTFGVTQAFGRTPDPGTALPYLEVGGDDWWVADPSSRLYNTHQVCSPGTCPFDERRSENLRAAGHAYDDAVVIDANMAPTVPDGGSAYFLHIGDAPTAGCVAADEDDVVATLRWLRPDAHPVISIGVRAGA